MAHKFGNITSYQSASGGGTWYRYMYMGMILESDEYLTNVPEISTTAPGITIDDEAVNTGNIVDKSITISSGKAVEFRVTCDIEQIIDAPLIISIETTNNNRMSVAATQPIVITEV